MATIKVHFEARHPSNSFPVIGAESLEKLQEDLTGRTDRIKNKTWSDPKDKDYWVQHHKELTLHKVTTIVEDL